MTPPRLVWDEDSRSWIAPAACPDNSCPARLVAARADDGEQVTVFATPPTEYVPGAKCWRCPHGERWYTTPAFEPARPEEST